MIFIAGVLVIVILVSLVPSVAITASAMVCLLQESGGVRCGGYANLRVVIRGVVAGSGRTLDSAVGVDVRSCDMVNNIFLIKTDHVVSGLWEKVIMATSYDSLLLYLSRWYEQVWASLQ